MFTAWRDTCFLRDFWKELAIVLLDWITHTVSIGTDALDLNSEYDRRRGKIRFSRNFPAVEDDTQEETQCHKRIRLYYESFCLFFPLQRESASDGACTEPSTSVLIRHYKSFEGLVVYLTVELLAWQHQRCQKQWTVDNGTLQLVYWHTPARMAARWFKEISKTQENGFFLFSSRSLGETCCETAQGLHKCKRKHRRITTLYSF